MADILKASDQDIARFMSYVEKLPNGCWYWTGARSRGQVTANGTEVFGLVVAPSGHTDSLVKSWARRHVRPNTHVTTHASFRCA